MPRRNAIDVVSYAWEHMAAILFRPMRWSIWWRVAVLGFLTGEMHSSGGINFQGIPQFPQEHQHKLLAHMPGVAVIALIAALIAAGLVLVVVFAYVGSVCRFILFDAVLTRRFAIREGWRKWQPQGLRLFGFNLLMLLATMMVLAVLAIPALLFFFKYKEQVRGHLMLAIAGGALLFTVAIAIGLVLSLVYTLVKDFVVPQMALENLTLGEGWRRLWTWMKAEKGQYAGYIGMKIVLSLAAAVAIGIAFVILLLVLLIPTAIVAIVIASLAKGHALAVGLIALIVVLGIFVAALLICVIALLTAPIAVFFPAYSMHFFADRYPPLAGLLYPQPPPAPTPPPAPEPPVGPDLAPAT
ncbi:MAG TPA: hypothetical protein VL382_10460 [Terriglobales bacterium]|nr:hypothetical protein [Terriglobales bacterium]